MMIEATIGVYEINGREEDPHGAEKIRILRHWNETKTKVRILLGNGTVYTVSTGDLLTAIAAATQL